MKISHGDLRVTITNALAFVADDDSLPILATVQITAADGALTFRATDRYKLLRQILDIPEIRVGVDEAGKPQMASQPVEDWAASIGRAQLKQALAVAKLSLGSNWAALVDVEFDLDGLSIAGWHMPHFCGQFPDVDRHIIGLPDKLDEAFDGSIGFGPKHLAALDKLRLRPTDRHAPAVKFRIFAGGKNAKPVLFTPADHRDGLAVDGLIMPYKLNGDS